MNTKQFVHLHVHSHYSIMNGCNTVPQLVDRAIKDRMKGMALTDTGNMYGIMEFFDYVSKVNAERKEKGQSPFKPIMGCELYLSPDKGESAYPFTLLAKNLMGYKNLMKLVSLSGQKHEKDTGFIDYSTLEHYHEGIIVCSGGIGSEVSRYALQGKKGNLTRVLEWFKRVFADDYYVELQRTTDGTKYENALQVLVKAAREQQIKLIAANDVRYTIKRYAEAYEYQNRIALGDSMPKNWPESANQKWLKSRNEMNELFADIPEAIESTMEILEKVEFYDIHHAPVFPKASLDNAGLKQGNSDDDNLRELVYEKAKQIYSSPLPEDVDDRLRFELDVIKEHNSSGYFLFVQELVTVAKEQLGVLVGPGRSSAAGSLVCYCLGITKIDPLKHDLLFERFLSIEGTMFPDIDIDFDDEGRDRVIEWLQDKYGKECCAHIVSFSTFSTANAFSTIARVNQLHTPETMAINEVLSSHYGYSWRSIKDVIKYEPKLKKLVRKAGQPLNNAIDNTAVLERKIRGLGIHACGFIVANDPITNWAPISTVSIEDSKGNEQTVRCTQYDGLHVESSGLIKFDFLGLKTLSQMRDICLLIKTRRNENFNIDVIPIDDEKTMKLFQTGQTEDVFQFNYQGMQKFLRELHPTCFEDLVIMNCMYRPGPMEDIPTLVKHKKSKKGIKYIIPCMEKYLQNTYGIIVYQEQLMMLSRLIANFNRGESDLLRKALGKRKTDELSILRPKFIEGGMKNGHKKNALEKVWSEMERKGIYAFNKSHAVCYTWLAYQMAYLKANYPEEFKQALEKYSD